MAPQAEAVAVLARQPTLCTVCMYKMAKDFYTAPCGHRLHHECIAGLRSAQTDARCPNCRASLDETTPLLRLEEGIASGLQSYERRSAYAELFVGPIALLVLFMFTMIWITQM
ncbi:hypothetical protein EV175_005259 [Coemansia sp. RSA 1933]|nr:hypothetical protein EV175_005259 [Coemansia sp. RSA 1933]